MVASNRVRNNSKGSSRWGYMRVKLCISCVLIFYLQVVLIGGISVYCTMTGSKLPGVGFVFYATQVIIAIMALIGSHGAHSRDPKSLKVFSYPIFVLSLIILIFALKAVITDWNEKNEELYKFMEKSAKEYQFDKKPNDWKSGGTTIWDFAQEYFDCCGWDDFQDWQEWKSIWSIMDIRLPRSCCPKGSLDVCTTMSLNIHPKGCGRYLAKSVRVLYILLICESLFYMELAVVAYVLAKYWDSDHADDAPVDA